MRFTSILIIFAFFIHGSLCPLLAQAELLSPDVYFKNGNYAVAYDGYQNLSKRDKSQQLQYAISAYHINQLDIAAPLFESLLGAGYKVNESNYYLGRIAHDRADFKTAAKYYKDFLRKGRSDGRRAEVVSRIKRCAAGIKLAYRTQESYIENLGSVVNSTHDEIGIRQSPNFSDRYYYSSNRPGSSGGMRDQDGLRDHNFGKHQLDIYSTSSTNGQWSEPRPINNLINTSKNDILQDFTPDGLGMIFKKGLSKNEGEIYLDLFTLDSLDLKQSAPYETKMIGSKGDAYIQIFNDSTYLFSSRRSTGYGAYDIYIMVRRDSIWQEPINLGDQINGPYDEVCPFLTKDGTKLYFSSNNLSSMGGFDVFVSEYSTKDSIWSSPVNLGSPINSPGDDTHLIVNRDGMSCMLSSDRKSGYGGHDLYIAYLRQQERNHLFDQRGALAFLPYTESIIADSAEAKPIMAEIESTIPEPILSDTLDTAAEKSVASISVGTLLYGEDEVILTPSNRSELNTVAGLLSLYPEILLELHGHCSYQGNPSFELYFSIKRAEKAYQYLIDKGISKDRIDVKGFGSYYPKVLDTGLANNPLERMNRRIEFHFSNVDSSRLEIARKPLNIPPRFIDHRKEKFLAANSGLSYRVEIARVGQMYQNNGLRFFDDVVISKDKRSDKYIYTIGIHQSFSHAKVQQDELIRNNFTDAKVNPFMDGQLMENARIVDATNKYPDLLNYLKDLR